MPDNSDLLPLFASAGSRYGIDPTFLMAISRQESGINPNVRDSYQGAQGLMQIMPATAAGLGITDARDPRQAIPAAAAYLAEGYAKTGTPEGAIQYYHGGPDERQWGPKTRAYLQGVSANYARMKKQDPQKDPYADIYKEFSGALQSPAAVSPSAAEQPPAVAASSPAAGGNDYGALYKEFSGALGTPQKAQDSASTPAAVQTPKSPTVAPRPSLAWRGTVLPVSSDEKGNLSLDLSAGLWERAQNALTSVKNAATLPGDVLLGKVDPNSDAAIGRAFDLATIGTPLNAGATIRATAPAIVAPSSDALREASTAGYNAVKGMDVAYSAPAVADLAKGIKQGLNSEGIVADLAPVTHKYLDKLANPAADEVRPIGGEGGLEATRRLFGKAGGNFNNPTDQEAARIAKGALQDFMEHPPEGAVISGDSATASKTLAEARGNYAAAKRGEKITGAEEAASLRAEASHSGLNSDNAMRSRAASLLLNKKAIAGFSDEERAALESVARGDAGRNALRFVGNYFGGGGGLGALAATAMTGMAGYGASGLNPWGLAAGLVGPAIGTGSRMVANRLTSGALGRADQMVRSNSPLFNQLTAGAMEPNLLLGEQAAVRTLPFTLQELLARQQRQ